MKKLISLIIMVLVLCFTASAFAATIEAHYGTYVHKYKIDDATSPYDNHIFYFATVIPEVVVQISGVNYHTFSENQLCWEDHDETLCPDDIISTDPIVYRMPAIMEMIRIWTEHGSTTLAPLTELQEKGIYLAFWHEYKMKKVATDSIAEMVIEEMNDLQQRRALKFIYFGHGIDISTSQSIANDRITNSIVATYVDYNIATVPLQDRRLLHLFGKQGWFEPAE